MTENYKILLDEEKFLEFVDWLPDLQENEKFYACLFMRKKYCKDVPWIKSDKGQLKRFLTDKERFKDKIRQLEVAVGAYTFDDNPTPQESLALYMTPNPRDMWKATVRCIGKFANMLECQTKNANPHQEAMSEIQRTVGERKFIMFDIDDKNPDILKEVIRLTDGYCDITETRGGYHVFVLKEFADTISEKNKLWYPEIAKFADQAGDNMTPVVGTYQGGHLVKFLRKDMKDV